MSILTQIKLGGELVALDVTETTGDFVLPTNSKAMLVVDLYNTGPDPLIAFSISRRPWVGGYWQVLNDDGASYVAADPQVLAQAVDPAQPGYEYKDPTTLPAFEWVRIFIPADGMAEVQLSPRTDTGDTAILSGGWSTGDY